MNPHNLAVGQKLWFVEMDQLGRTRGGSPVTLKKIGRCWAQTNGGIRIHLETLNAVEPGYPLGRAHLSKEAYAAENLVERAWRTLARALNSKFHAPDGVTIEDMAEAARLLRLDAQIQVWERDLRLPLEAPRG